MVVADVDVPERMSEMGTRPIATVAGHLGPGDQPFVGVCCRRRPLVSSRTRPAKLPQAIGADRSGLVSHRASQQKPPFTLGLQPPDTRRPLRRWWRRRDSLSANTVTPSHGRNVCCVATRGRFIPRTCTSTTGIRRTALRYPHVCDVRMTSRRGTVGSNRPRGLLSASASPDVGRGGSHPRRIVPRLG